MIINDFKIKKVHEAFKNCADFDLCLGESGHGVGSGADNHANDSWAIECRFWNESGGSGGDHIGWADGTREILSGYGPSD